MIETLAFLAMVVSVPYFCYLADRKESEDNRSVSETVSKNSRREKD